MSKKIALLAGAALVLSAGALPAFAQPGPGPDHGRPGPARGGFAMGEAFARADANNDGKVTQDEGWAWLSARFREVDSNDDGGVTMEEMRSFAQAHMGRGGPPRRAEQHGQAMFRALDANADGKVTLEEVRPFAEAMFRARDANSDGALARDEVRPARGMRGMHRGHHAGGNNHGDERRGPQAAPRSN